MSSFYLYIIVTLINYIILYVIAVETREYCFNEVFEAKCLKNEVIVMNSAIYGRMRMGRCLQDPGLHTAFGNDSRFFGCFVDILSFMDSKCSGRNPCEVRGTDVSFQQESPCYADLKTYMEASYECLTGKLLTYYIKLAFMQSLRRRCAYKS